MNKTKKAPKEKPQAKPIKDADLKNVSGGLVSNKFTYTGGR